MSGLIFLSRKSLLACVFLLLPVIAGGCGPTSEYLIAMGVGELDVLSGSVPIDQALADPETDPEIRAKLLWVAEVRQFAQQQIGLTLADNYQTFYDTGDRPAIYNFSAASKDSLRSISWDFPILGTVQFLNYFHLHLAEDLAEDFEALID